MSEQPSLKREGTMAVTAQEGGAFLESHGMKLSDDVAKTRGQKEKLDEITNEGASGGEVDNGTSTQDKPKVPREGTMEVTAKEGQALLGNEELEKTRTQMAVAKEIKKPPPKPRLPRDSTMAVTAQEGKLLLQGEELEKTRSQTASASPQKSPTTPTSKVKRSSTIARTTEASAHILGQDQRGRTRSQTRKFSESDDKKQGDDKKPAVKRTSTMAQTAKEGEEFLARESKRPKTDENVDVSTEPAGTDQTTAED